MLILALTRTYSASTLYSIYFISNAANPITDALAKEGILTLPYQIYSNLPYPQPYLPYHNLTRLFPTP